MRSERSRREIDRLIESGWRIEEETPERTVLVNREYGDVVVHLLLLVLTFWTGGIVNLLYAGYKYLNSPRRVIRDERRTCPDCGAEVPADAEFCPSCGVELPAVEPARATCPDCGAPITPGANYCPSCGAAVGTAEGTADEGTTAD